MAKAWGQLTAAYRRRLERGGITAKTYGTPAGNALRKAARGHGKTPERPERARGNPNAYRDYLNRRAQVQRDVIAKKERLWGDVHKYKPGNANKAVMANPVPEFKQDYQAMRRFLSMSDNEAMTLVAQAGLDADRKRHQVTQWYFMFYH